MTQGYYSANQSVPFNKLDHLGSGYGDYAYRNHSENDSEPSFHQQLIHIVTSKPRRYIITLPTSSCNVIILRYHLRCHTESPTTHKRRPSSEYYPPTHARSDPDVSGKPYSAELHRSDPVDLHRSSPDIGRLSLHERTPDLHKSTPNLQLANRGDRSSGDGWAQMSPKFSEDDQMMGPLPSGKTHRGKKMTRAGFEELKDAKGRIYYVNHIEKSTTFENPRLWKGREPFQLPRGWERKFDEKGIVYYVDHLYRYVRNYVP